MGLLQHSVNQCFFPLRALQRERLWATVFSVFPWRDHFMEIKSWKHRGNIDWSHHGCQFHLKTFPGDKSVFSHGIQCCGYGIVFIKTFYDCVKCFKSSVYTGSSLTNRDILSVCLSIYVWCLSAHGCFCVWCEMSFFQILMNVLTTLSVIVTGSVITQLAPSAAYVIRVSKPHRMGKGVWVSLRLFSPTINVMCPYGKKSILFK